MAARPKQAEPRPTPRLYLVTPRVADATAFAGPLAAALAAGDVAAVLLRLTEADEGALIDIVKALAPVAQAKDVALLLDGHADLVARAGCDGAHLTGTAELAAAFDILKPDHIAGAGGLTTRHDAMATAERGADYVMFGEPDSEGVRPSFAAIEERVAWWAEVFEAPCVAYAAGSEDIAPLVAAGADFIALGGSFGDWIWRDPHHVAATVADAARRMLLPEPTA